jgi:hypothetical protein
VTVTALPRARRWARGRRASRRRRAVIPGVGPFHRGGCAGARIGLAGASVATGALAGAATGGLVGALTDYGVSESDSHYYESGVRRGGVIVTVDLTSAGMSESAVSDVLYCGRRSQFGTRGGHDGTPGRKRARRPPSPTKPRTAPLPSGAGPFPKLLRVQREPSRTTGGSISASALLASIAKTRSRRRPAPAPRRPSPSSPYTADAPSRPVRSPHKVGQLRHRDRIIRLGLQAGVAAGFPPEFIARRLC